MVKAPDHGTLDGLRYTPAPGFTGQDAVIYRVSNGAGESEAVRVTIFVVPRPGRARAERDPDGPARAVPQRPRAAAARPPPAHDWSGSRAIRRARSACG